jgi:hypothetical protein
MGPQETHGLKNNYWNLNAQYIHAFIRNEEELCEQKHDFFFFGKPTFKTWHEGSGELLDFSTIPIYQNQDVIINEPSIWKIRFINKYII